MHDIITFGSATWDIFMRTKKFKIVKSKKFLSGKAVCVGLGSKINVEDINFSSGGGGTNTAVTFVKQGFKTSYCGMVGDDIEGEKIIEELKRYGIGTSLIAKTKIKRTNHSVVLNTENDDRTILVYRGASELFSKRDAKWNSLKAKWYYLAPFSGMLSGFSKSVVDFAHDNGIKIALNPGSSQLGLPLRTLQRILKKVDVLILNQEEASVLTKTKYSREKEIFKKLDSLCPGITIMTKGDQGVVVSDGKFLYRAVPDKIDVVGRTGAGDSFASGFVSALIREKDVEEGIQLGIANANACLSGWGAKSNLMEKDTKFKKVKIDKELCSENGLCQVKL